VHQEPVILPVLFVLALALCALYRRTESLLPCFAAHATFNSFAVLLIILSGLGVLPTPA
jgi:membrane protease YdiL (CAAX protease family)